MPPRPTVSPDDEEHDHSAERPRMMRRSRRKLIGVAATIAFVVVYALVAMALSQIRFDPGAPSVWQWLFYAVVGMGWILPLMPLIRWMERPDEPQG